MQDSTAGGRGSWCRSRRRVALAILAGVVMVAGAATGLANATGDSVAVATDVSTDASTVTTVADASSASGTAALSSAPTRSRGRFRQWPPTPHSTGVPTGTVLKRYQGPCTITRTRVIAKKVINCSPLEIKAVGVVIRKSRINGSIRVGTQDDANPTEISDPAGDGPIRVTVRKSEIDASRTPDVRPIGSSHYVVKFSHLHGTFSGAECHNACTIKWSYVHGFGSHASGLRILRNGRLRHNTIWCEPNPSSDDDHDGVPDADGGCSGNLVMYEEFGTPRNNVVRHNYFPAGRFWYSLKFNGRDHGRIRIVNNRFGRPRSGGTHVADDWDPKPTNIWSGNTLTNGRVARP
jgi:hypothetical protein